MRTIYTVSYQATKNDNGHCASFFNREIAEKTRVELLKTCWHVGEVSCLELTQNGIDLRLYNWNETNVKT